MTTNYYIESLKETRTDYLPQLLEELVSREYSIIEMEDWKDEVFLLVESDNVEGQILEGKLYFDSKECFNKPSSCCLHLPIPINQSQVNFVLDKLEWLVTDEGKAYSDDFNYIEDYEAALTYITPSPKLYIVFLGGNLPPNRFGEDHEIVTVVANSQEEAKKLAKSKWSGYGKAHIDGIMQVDVVDGYKVNLTKVDGVSRQILETDWNKLNN